jgi:hypothetical protein
VITDLERIPHVISGVSRIERLDAGSGFDVGTRWRETRRFFGKEATEEMEVSSIDPGRSFVHLADSHSVHYISKYTVEPTGDGTLLSLSFAAQPQSGFAKFMAATVGRLMKASTRRALQKDFDDIARAVEG